MRRVDREHPCPICSRPDWCLVREDGSAAICARIEEGSRKRCGDSGWLHIIREEDRSLLAPVRRTIEVRVGPDWTAHARLVAVRTSDAMIDELAASLGVHTAALRSLLVGWSERRRAWCFPMRAPDGRVCGVRLRNRDGSKRRAERGEAPAVRGSRNGLFLPDLLEPRGLLVVTEGETDCAAALSMNLPAIGRAGCNQGRDLVSAIAAHRETVIVHDNDEPGRRGAESLACAVLLRAQSVRLAAPPLEHKDVRDWFRACGADAVRAEILRLIEQAVPLELGRVEVRL